MDDLRALVPTGATVAVGDGAGLPTSVLSSLSDAAAAAGGVRLLLGWCPVAPTGLTYEAFADTRTIMAGYGLRADVDAGRIGYIPTRLATVPKLLHDSLHPTLLVASVASAGHGFRFTTEVAWLRAAVDAGARVAGVRRPAAHGHDIGPPLERDSVVIVDEDTSPPLGISWSRPGDAEQVIGERVAALVPVGARLQFGPGPVGTAMLEALRKAVRIDTGVITDAVADLDARGLLVGSAYGSYLAGAPALYSWADGRVNLDRVELTHDPGRLVEHPLVAVNTALEIDLDGAANVEAAGGSAVAGIGGHPDYALAASRTPGGLSIVALPTMRGGRSTLVEHLAAPASTPSHDVDIVVTERGCADMRGRTRPERRRLIERLWT